MTYNELVALHTTTDMTDRKARRAFYAAMNTAPAADLREFNCYLTERGAQGVAA